MVRNLLVKPSFHDGWLYNNLNRVQHDWSCPDQLICLLIQLTIHEYDQNLLNKYKEFEKNHLEFSLKDAAIIIYIFEGVSSKLDGIDTEYLKTIVK